MISKGQAKNGGVQLDHVGSCQILLLGLAGQIVSGHGGKSVEDKVKGKRSSVRAHGIEGVPEINEEKGIPPF